MPKIHEFNLRVYYQDTNAPGIVFHGNFLGFAERARVEFLRSFGLNQSYIREVLGVQFVIRHCEVSYHAPARLEDELRILTHIEEINKTSLVFIQKVYKEDKL